MGKLEECIPPKTRERLGKEFKVTKDTAKVLYFELCCDLNFIDGDLEKFFLQFSDDELISWNNEYFKYMDNKLNAMYEEEVSFENLDYYSFLLYVMSYVYTTSKENYILYLENIKKFISKYGYIMFYGIEGTKYDNLIQYALTDLFKIFMFEINERFLYTHTNRITLKKEYPSIGAYGLIPIFIELGYNDLLKECFEIINQSFDIKNVMKTKELMDYMNIRFINSNIANAIPIIKERRLNRINSYLKSHKIKKYEKF
ncbi:MAG: hypothetical protein K6G28_05965 [Acholeplasmatales bacterium]|nr:hypothetical protein [Acholeplasmatales bacterium]